MNSNELREHIRKLNQQHQQQQQQQREIALKKIKELRAKWQRESRETNAAGQ